MPLKELPNLKRNRKSLSLCCHNKVWQTGWLINNRKFFLTVLEIGKSKIQMLVDLVPSESLLPGS